MFVAEYLHPVFPEAEGIAASLPGRDILKTPGWAIEVKATKDFNPTAFMQQATKNAGSDFPISIYRPHGYGEAKIGYWVAMTSLHHMREIIDYIQQLERRVAELSTRIDMTEQEFLEGYRQDLLP